MTLCGLPLRTPVRSHGSLNKGEMHAFCPSGQLLSEIRMSYARTKVWVWFKGCVVPTWRISDKEPTDIKKGPAIPADAKCKFNG